MVRNAGFFDSMKIVSFYTPHYKPVAEKLLSSLHQFSLPYYIKEVPCRGSWVENCAFKPTFILQALQKLKEPLLWVDADGYFVRGIDYEFQGDLSIHVNDLPSNHPSKVISSTVFINNSKEAISFLQKWIQECEDTQNKEWDQVCLRDAYLKNKTALITTLPPRYLKIYDKEQKKEDGEPVIIQTQASRLYQKVVDGELSVFW